MNWDAIGAVAELLGAIGVIASLVYLATQIRQSREQMSQNTRALKASSYQQLFENLGDATGRRLDNSLWERAVRLGLDDYAGLPAEDAFRFDWWMLETMRAFDNGHYQYRVGMLDEERWRIHYLDVASYFQNPGVREWWRMTTPNVSPHFVALVEEIRRGDAAADPEP